MNTDTKLRQCFQELRSADAQWTPLFSRVVRAPVPVFTFPWLRLAAGAAVVVALLVVVRINRQPVVDTQQWVALSNWQATTDELLTVANTPWGSTLSTPTDSWIENSNQTNQKETL
ncbi:MAG: hypothetical protein WCH84_04920 [Verrucomicrobiota bacterium]